MIVASAGFGYHGHADADAPVDLAAFLN